MSLYKLNNDIVSLLSTLKNIKVFSISIKSISVSNYPMYLIRNVKILKLRKNMIYGEICKIIDKNYIRQLNIYKLNTNMQ